MHAWMHACVHACRYARVYRIIVWVYECVSACTCIHRFQKPDLPTTHHILIDQRSVQVGSRACSKNLADLDPTPQQQLLCLRRVRCCSAARKQRGANWENSMRFLREADACSTCWSFATWSCFKHLLSVCSFLRVSASRSSTPH